jgi:hypothetical protein
MFSLIYIQFAGVLLLIVLGTLSWHFVSQMRSVRVVEPTTAGPTVSMDRYRPMLRLLSDEDLMFVSANAHLSKTLRATRRQLFRGYLNCMTRDYSRLLGGVRAVMAQAGIDRPDLAKALVKNRALFAIAVCKVEFRLTLHAAGVGKVDISALVGAMETLSSQVRSLAAVPQLASN